MPEQPLSENYDSYMAAKETEWESLCLRCGACCGAPEDPCVHLSKDDQGGFICAVYRSRFGLHQSQSGKFFKCVPIRDIMHKHWQNDHQCAYKKRLRSPWTGLSG